MSWLRMYSLRKRVFLMVGIGLALILTVLTFFSLRTLQDSANHVLTERLSMARLVAGHIDDHIADIFTLLERAAESKGFDLTDADPAPERRTLRELFRADIFSCHLFITDPRGVVLLTDPHSSKFAGEDRSGQPYIAAALRTGRPQVSGHFICPTCVSSRIGVVIPAKDRKGAMVGLLGGVTDPTSQVFAGILRSLPSIEAGHIDVVDADGIVLTSTNPAFVAKQSHHPGIADLIKSGTVTTARDVFTDNGHPQGSGIVVFAPLKNAPWGVIIAQAESVVLAPVNALRRQLTTLGVIFVVLALFVTWLTTKAVVAPIRQLLTASRRIGAGEMGTPIAVAGRDEVAELAHGFEAMRQQLAARGEALETAVRKRTRELSILLAIVRTAAESHNLEDVFNLAMLKTNIGGKIFMLEKNGQLTLAAHQGMPADHPCLREPVRMGECLCGLVARDGRMIVSEDVAGDERHTRCWPGMSPHKEICVPLVARDRVMGVMSVWLPIHQKVTESDLDLLKAVGQQLGGVVQNARLREAEQRALEEKLILEERLQHADKMEAIGTLAGGIAHDFNNLLMGIQGYASLALLDLDSSDPNYERLKRIEAQVLSGADLTKQLLGFARGGRYEVKPTDMNDILKKSSSMFGRTKKEITIHRKFGKDLWPVEVDRGQMEQVFMNLYVNAWQAMPGGGEIYLETEDLLLDEEQTAPYGIKPGKYVKITVTDTGTGMDEKTKARIFDPFFTTKEMGRGTGLGLATVYGIIKGHKGMIHVDSEPTYGTTFTIYLPASEKEVVKEKAATETIARGTETILLVDDEKTVLEVSREMLEFLGYHVYTAGSGQEAIAVYMEKQKEIDLVMLDMIMPGISGGETFDRLREINPDAKALLSSGYSINGQAHDILDRGCNGFIQKPFRLETLSGKIRKVLES